MEATPGRYHPEPLRPGRAARRVLVPDRVLGTLILIFTEAMFFSGLISAFLIIRGHSVVWPPPGQPRLPVAATALNTALLLISAFTMWRATGLLRAAPERRQAGLQWLLATLVLGATFLAIQGYEWIRLIRFGLTSGSGVYGGLFYALVGSHGAHVLGAVIALALVHRGARRATLECSPAAPHREAALAMSLFWYFVVAVWPVLYVLVYLW